MRNALDNTTDNERQAMNWDKHIKLNYWTQNYSDAFRLGFLAMLNKVSCDDCPIGEDRQDWEDGWYRANGDIVQAGMGEFDKQQLSDMKASKNGKRYYSVS